MSFASTSNSAQARVTTLKPEIKHGTRDFHSFADELGSDNSMDERSDDEDTRRTSIKKGIKVKGSNSSSLKGRRRYSKKSSYHSSVENPLRELLGRDFDIPAFHRKPATSDQPVSPLSNSFSDADEASSHGIIPSPRQQLLRRVVTTPVKKRQASGSPTASEEDIPDFHLVLKRRKTAPLLAGPSYTPEHNEGSSTASDEDNPRFLVAGTSGSHLQSSKLVKISGSDTEDDDIEQSYLNHRPSFRPDDEQKHKGPYKLDAIMGIMVPKSIAMFLRPYQEEGVRFFWERYKEGRGGVLGDDMGLGKTIQVISFLAAIMRKSGDQSDEKRRYKYIDGLLNDVGMKGLPPANSKWPTCLIIAPRPLVGNWERELLMWGYFETGIYLGSNEERDNVLRNFKMGRLDILLTSHESAQQHINLLDDLKLSCVFVDEAHKIKNEKTKTFEAYMQFACQVRFGLSGTVIQNSYSEMWPLLTWSNPGRLGTKDQWEQTIARPLKEGQSKNATDKEHAEFAELADRFVKRLMPKFFLRRTKDIIKDQLPKKIDKVVFCPLTKTQIEVYKRFLATEDVQLMLRKDEPCQCGSKKTRGRCCYKANAEGVPWKNLMFTYIDIFIKISNSLLLIYPGPTDESEQVKRNRDLLKIAFPGRNPGTYTMVLHNKELCGKWDVLSRLLKVWYDEGAGNKVLIFSKSLKLLEFLTYSLEQEGTNFRKLDGKTKQDERYRNIDEFNLDPKVFVFLISTKVGGTGLNLIAANKVVIFDPNWNPAQDLQAMDRAYRFGQRRDVSVYRFLGAGSLEELVYARQLYKQQQMKIGYDASHQTRLFAGIQGDSERQGELFGLKNMFALRTDLATKEQIEDAHLQNLEWALANKEVGRDQSDIQDSKSLAEFVLQDEEGGLKLASKPAIPLDSVEAIFAERGMFTHVNDHVLRENYVEAQKAQEAVKNVKQRGLRRSRTSLSPSKAIEGGRAFNIHTASHKSSEKVGASKLMPWPPVRAHHKTTKPRTYTPEERLAMRRKALFKLGVVTDEQGYLDYASRFSHLSVEEQQIELERLDAQHPS